MPGRIVATVGVAALLLPFGSPNSGELRVAEALLVIVPPVELATTPVTVTGGYDPISAGPVYVHVTVNPERAQFQFVPTAETKVKSVSGGNASINVTASVALGPALFAARRYRIVLPAATI